MRVQPQSAWHDSRRQRKQFRFKSDVKWYGYMLGGGFKYFIFSPLLGEMIQFDEYFSDGLVQPPTSSWHFRNLTSNFWSFNPSCHGMLSKRPSWGSALEYCESFLAIKLTAPVDFFCEVLAESYGFLLKCRVPLCVCQWLVHSLFFCLCWSAVSRFAFGEVIEFSLADQRLGNLKVSKAAKCCPAEMQIPIKRLKEFFGACDMISLESRICVDHLSV